MKYISIIFFLFSSMVFAGDIPVPRITESTTYSATATYTIADVGPSADIVPPEGEGVSLMMLFRNSGRETTMDPYKKPYWKRADGIKTVGEIAMEIYDDYGSYMEQFSLHGVTPSDDDCIGWGYGDIAPQSAYAIGVATIVGGCAPIPPPGFSCNIDSQNIELDHHSLTKQSVNGNSVSTSINVSCDSETAVKFSLSTDLDYIELSPSGTSELFVNDLPLNSEIELPAGSSTIKLNDKLSGVTETGVSSGSSVLVIKPY
ncbi:hypothetical protein BKF00_21720 [Salmonella enterica]|nr:hypothetical protein [Salmonella enterica]